MKNQHSQTFLDLYSSSYNILFQKGMKIEKETENGFMNINIQIGFTISDIT